MCQSAFAASQRADSCLRTSVCCLQPGADCKDKFLVQCVKLGPSDAKEVTSDMFDAAKQKDIRCELEGCCSAPGNGEGWAGRLAMWLPQCLPLPCSAAMPCCLRSAKSCRPSCLPQADKVTGGAGRAAKTAVAGARGGGRAGVARHAGLPRHN